MGDRASAFLPGHLHEFLRYQRSAERGAERVLAFIESVRLYRRVDVAGDKLVASIDLVVVSCSQEVGPLPYLPEVILLAEVERYRNDVSLVLLLQPLDADGGVEAARICESYGESQSDEASQW